MKENDSNEGGELILRQAQRKPSCCPEEQHMLTMHIRLTLVVLAGASRANRDDECLTFLRWKATLATVIEWMAQLC